MLRRGFLALTMLCAALAATAPAALAEENPVVVELFTSQGCSSCPPADKLLAELGKRDDVIPLALHVDYWDYIGWKDGFARPEFTRRQKGYARAGGWGAIYTPQMVINGMDDVVGSRPGKVDKLIAAHRAKPAKVRLQIARDTGMLRISAQSLHGGTAPCDVQIVRYLPSENVQIARGENAGRELTYSHVAQQWDMAARWDGRGQLEMKVPLNGDGPVVVLLQEPGYGPIVAAARLR